MELKFIIPDTQQEGKTRDDEVPGWFRKDVASILAECWFHNCCWGLPFLLKLYCMLARG